MKDALFKAEGGRMRDEVIAHSFHPSEIVNVVVASMVKTYATFLVCISISLVSASFILSGLR